jgi:hypothetical protein
MTIVISLVNLSNCRFPVDRVPSYIVFKTRQGTVHATTRCHVSHSYRPCLHVEEGSDVARCPVALDLASLMRRASALPRVLWLRTSPSCQGGLWRGHVSYGFRPRLHVEEGSCATTRPAAPYPASPLRRAPVLPRVLWLSVGYGPQL